MTQGIFISFEGIDGAGKSSHIGALSRAFEAAGRVVTPTREPGGTALAESLRSLVLNQPMDAMTEALLVFAARRDHLKQCIEPALHRGEVVLCDRFTDATFAYQGGGRGFDWETLRWLEQLVQARDIGGTSVLCQPSLTLWFDLAPAIAAERLQQARTPDKFESESLDFFTRVRQGYVKRQEADPMRFARIEADQSREAVWNDVLTTVRTKAWLP